MKIAAIINSISCLGKRQAIIATLERELAGHELISHPTEYSGHATELAREAVASHVETIVVAGGDGTISQVVNGIVGANVRLGIIPIGTANDLAGHFGVPISLNHACSIIREGHTQAIDAIRINDRYFVTTAGFGIGCATIASVQQIRRSYISGRWLARIAGSRLYALGYIKALAHKQDWPCSLSVRRNGLDMHSTALSLTISNLPRLGASFNVAPSAKADDGEFDVCLIEDSGRPGAVAAAVKASRCTLATWSQVHRWRARTLLVHSDRAVPVFADGELLASDSRFEISIIPKAINLITPVAHMPFKCTESVLQAAKSVASLLAIPMKSGSCELTPFVSCELQRQVTTPTSSGSRPDATFYRHTLHDQEVN